MKILALDLGSTTGWAYGCPGKPTRYGVEVFKGTRTERLGSFTTWLNRLLGMELDRGLDVVVYERPFARGLHATRSLGHCALKRDPDRARRARTCTRGCRATVPPWPLGCSDGLA